MEVHFKDNKLEKQCTNEREMQREFQQLSKRLKRRMKALEAAESVADLRQIDPTGRWHSVDSLYKGCYAGEISGNVRIVIEPDPLGSLAATVVTVITVKDYHRG